MDFNTFTTLTFDCYGTLIDWESGILAALQPVLARHGVTLDDTAILERYARYELEAQSEPYRRYLDIMRAVMLRFAQEFSFECTAAEAETLANSLSDWQPFPDTVAALRELKQRYQLAIISNIDDDLFALSAVHLQVPFDFVITAEQVGSYKPSRRNFEVAIERIGQPRERILHVGQSLYHDVIPAKALGLSTVWVNRRKGKAGFGATVPATAQPDLEVPDLATLVKQRMLS